MDIEFEAKFLNIDPKTFRKKLIKQGAKLITTERLMKRALFGSEFEQGRWLRLRDEGDQVTLTFKNRASLSVGGTEEVEVAVSDFESTLKILTLSKLPLKAYQENKRESWELDGAQIEIDTWPQMSPHIEIEAESEEKVRNVAEKLGFNFDNASYAPADTLYAQENNISDEEAFERFKELRFK